MSDDLEFEYVDPGEDSSPTSVPECSRCGSPVVFVTMTGPTTQYAHPCGCLVNLAELD